MAVFANLFEGRALAEAGDVGVALALTPVSSTGQALTLSQRERGVHGSAAPGVVGVGDAGDVLGGEVAAGAIEHVAHLADVDEEGFVAAVLDRYETCPYGGTPDDEASFAIARLRVSGSETVAKVRAPPGLPIVYSNSWAFFLS